MHVSKWTRRDMTQAVGIEPRWNGIERPYTADDVVRLRGSIQIEYTLARMGAERCGICCTREPYVPALGALTGNQAVQQVQAGLKAIYLSGWQVAADANIAGQMYPDQSLYPATVCPAWCAPSTMRFMRADQIHHCDGRERHLLVRSDRGGCRSRIWRTVERLRTDEGHDRGRALPRPFRRSAVLGEEVRSHGRQGAGADVGSSIQKLVAARLAADVLGVPTSDHRPHGCQQRGPATSDIDPRDQPFLTGQRTPEGFFRIPWRHRSCDRARTGLCASMPTCIWCETSEPNLRRPGGSRRRSTPSYPGKLLAYNCSPSFNWKKKLDDDTIASFQRELARMGYKFQFVTLAGFHALNLSMFELARDYASSGNDRLLAVAGERVPAAETMWIRRGEASGVCRDGILRHNRQHHRGRILVHRGVKGIDGGRAVSSSQYGDRERFHGRRLSGAVGQVLRCRTRRGEALRDQMVYRRVEDQTDVRTRNLEIHFAVPGYAVLPVNNPVSTRIDGGLKKLRGARSRRKEYRKLHVQRAV